MSEGALLDPRKVRDQMELRVDLGDGTFVRARRCDLSMMLFEGIVPTPIMAAAQKFIENRELSPVERLADLGEDDKPAMLEVLRVHACTAVIEPPVVMMDDGIPDHLPVQLFTLQQLLAIWNQTAVIPKVGAAEAATFRLRQRPIAQPVLRPREIIRPAAESLVASDIERRGA